MRIQARIAPSWVVLSGILVLLTMTEGCQHLAGPGVHCHATPIDAIKAGIEKALNMTVTLKVETFRQDKEWAFVTGLPLTANGERIDYTQTVYADDVHDGYFDDGFIALVRKRQQRCGGWSVTALSLGATDAPFVAWPEQFGVPEELILPPAQ